MLLDLLDTVLCGTPPNAPRTAELLTCPSPAVIHTLRTSTDLGAASHAALSSGRMRVSWCCH